MSGEAPLRDPVCGMEFTREEAESLGAEKVEEDGEVHWFCSPVCRKAWVERRG